MWRQLSGPEKSRFVCFVIGLLAGVFAFILYAMTHDWVHAALAAFLVFVCVSRLNKLATRGRGTGEPQPHTINPGTAQAAEKTDTTTTKVRCLHCQHVQTAPRSQPTFVCGRCNAHLKRRTAPVDGS